MRRAVLLLLPLYAGCGCPPVAELTVNGGDAGTRSVVERAVADLVAWTGRDSVCVSSIELVDSLPDDRVGHYDGDVISLVADQEDLYTTAVHEMCHGIDRDDGIARKHVDEFPYDPEASDFAGRDEKSRAREAFAVTCEGGPRNLQVVTALDDECPLDAHTDGARRVLDEVFVEAPPFAPSDPGANRVDVASWTAPVGWRVPTPVQVAYTTQGTLAVVVVSDDAVSLAHLDPWTGELLDGGFVAPGTGVSWPGEPLPDSWDAVGVAEFDQGGVLATFRTGLANGDMVSGVVGWDRGWTLPSDPCAAPGSAFAQVGEEPWLVETDGSTVAWSRFRLD